MKKRSILIVLLVFSLLVTGVTAYALSDSKVTDSEATVQEIPSSMEVEEIAKAPVAYAAEEKNEAELETNLALADLDRPSQITKSAKDEELTQEAIYNRMLNTVDYFDTASIEFSYKGSFDVSKTDVSIDTDLRSHKAFQTRSDPSWNSDESFEDVLSNGVSISFYYNADKTYSYFGAAMGRSKAEDECLEKTPRHYIGEDEHNYGMDVWLHRADLTNASLASYCLFPENYAFTYLTDFTVWEITDQIEYLGRSCVVIEGDAGQYAGRFGNTTFKMYVDEATGILLMLEGYDAAGEVMNFVHVSEIEIDQYELTCTKLYEAINSGKYDDYVRAD